MSLTRLRQLARAAGRFRVPATGTADVATLAGIGCVAGGAALVSLPAGLIVLGLLLLVLGRGLERAGSRR